jgi:UPF0755 protein
MKRLAVLLLAVVLVAAGAAYVLFQRVNEPFRGYQGEVQLVDVPSGATTQTIGQRLIAAGVVRDALAYRLALWMSGEARRLQAGEYRFDAPMSAVEVVRKIARGEVDLVTITFPEGLTIAEMSKIFESNGFGSAASFVAAGQDASLVQALDPGARDLEGYLFPDTYSIPKRTDATRLVRAMTGQFLRELTPQLRQAAAARGLTPRQHVTLASLVEKETGRVEERPLIASVYSNRLKIGMALQCDPTVIYALTVAGGYDGNLRRDDLMFDSPYNTYRYPGLPPGPIAAPGRGALEAAAHPAESDYIYFVSRNDGSHEFARTLDEHNRNVHRWQVQYFRERRSGQ